VPIVSIGAIDDRETCFCGIEITAMGWNAICDWYIKGTATPSNEASGGFLQSPFAPRKNTRTLLSRSERRHFFRNDATRCDSPIPCLPVVVGANDMTEVIALAKVYQDATAGRYVAVDRVSFQVRPGEFFGLLGANGVGQKTLLRIVATMLRSTSGTVRVGGYDVEDSSADARRRIGFVSNDTAIEDRMTAQELLTFCGILNRLSGEHLRQRTESLIHDLKATGKCLIFSTHIRSEVKKLCDRMAVMHEGRILDCGTLSELRSRHRQAERPAGDALEQIVADHIPAFDHGECRRAGVIGSCQK